ncbi:MAG: PfkB family carbohydrate kinase [Ferruginibacter sp.]
MFELCTIGHITLDKIQTTQSIKYMPGGTAFYFTKALKNFEINYLLVTAVAKSEQYIIDELLKEGFNVIGLHSEHTVYFENIYPENMDDREQNVLHTADPFTTELVPPIDAKIFHLGPLLHTDFSFSLIKTLSAKGLVSLDVQGLLRYTVNKKVHYKDWQDKETILKYISIIKANEFEMEIITGTKDMEEGARYLAGLGVKEVVITNGGKGSLILRDNIFHKIPAIKPQQTIDTTGCGDTYMAGYLYKKLRGAGVEECGLYGAAMATFKIQSFGPFAGDAGDVDKILKTSAMENL